MKMILLVCTGNTCRSSMAEVVLKSLLQEEGDKRKDIKVVSAGVSALPGQRASHQAIQVMEEWGLDLRDHHAQPVTSKLVKEASLILTMTDSQKRGVLAVDRAAEGKTYTLKEFVRESGDEEKLNRERDSLCNLILDKREAFLKEHTPELQELKERRRRLQEELNAVEREIKDFEKMMMRELDPETQRLNEIQDLMSADGITDPFGHPLDVYRKCAEEIRTVLRAVVEKLNIEE